MTYTQSPNQEINQVAQAFRSLEVDEQLALFWFVYKEMGSSITPAAPGASTASDTIAEGLFDQVKELSHEKQLKVQRDLINKADTQISREYGSLSDTTKLLFWYLLAQGMDNGTIIPMPENYELSGSAQQVLKQVKEKDFEQQMTIFRDYVAPMGAEAKSGAEI